MHGAEQEPNENLHDLSVELLATRGLLQMALTCD